MARKSPPVAAPVPVLAPDDSLAYYTKTPAAGCQLRDIDAIEQMFGYYNAEQVRRSAPILPKLN